MRHSYEILEAKVARDHEKDADYIDVRVQVYEDRIVDDADMDANPDFVEQGIEVGETIQVPVCERSLGFALATPKEDITRELDAMVAVLDSDAVLAEKNADNDAAQEKARETVAALMGPEEES